MSRGAWKRPRQPRGDKLTCRICGAKVKHDQACNITERLFTCTCLACKERAEEIRDSGWQILPTRRGSRFHRELGLSLQLDVEMGGGLSWVASVVRDRQLVAVRAGLPSAAEAARAIEIAANAEALPLPSCDESGYVRE